MPINVQAIQNAFVSLPAYQGVMDAIQAGSILPGLGLPRSARLPFISLLHSKIPSPILFITDRADHALSLSDELGFWVKDGSTILFPEPNPLFYENASWGAVTRRDRLHALTILAKYHLPHGNPPNLPPILITTARSLMTRTLPRRDFLKATDILHVGQQISPRILLGRWIQSGYQIVNTVLEPGQFFRRGGILDIWPPAESQPYRIDFFGDEIDTIRNFDPSTQRTLQQVDSAFVPPAREFIVPDLHDELQQGEISEFHIPLMYPFASSILDYLPEESVVLVDDMGMLESLAEEFETQAVKFRQESIDEGTLPENFSLPYLPWIELKETLQNRHALELGYTTAIDQGQVGDLGRQFQTIERFGGRLKPFVDYLNNLVQDNCDVVIVSRQSTRLKELWQEQASLLNENQHEYIKQTDIEFIDGSLSAGWQLGKIVLITDSEIFGWERPQPRQRPQPTAEMAETAYADFKPGDWVVHVDYGIGKYIGLVQRSLEGMQREFLCVEYKNSDQLFVPVHQADRLTRYIGRDSEHPSPGHLGGQEWSEVKSRVREAVEEVASELLDLYARRQVAEGFQFSMDTPWQAELEDSFPYIETIDQAKVINEVKSDMESSRPMDRLLCGDVGYGKTEVALRAAFKAVMSGKQVALLVPTTVLAQQHYETFCQRLATFPVIVEMLSRFRTPHEQNNIIHQLALGTIDIVIGTHRLIQPDVKLKDLGLVIIDEEQRFGVTHKEHLKKLRTEVDVLTLTATPIPRTLYMALTGVRDISTLNTPPEERLPIVTHIGPYSQKLVRQAILRELERGGQIFFVHNRVQTISAMKMHLEKLVPEARVAVGHGQMPENDLASVMHRFSSGDIDILLSTSIIESGLDIPNANTLIVDRADTFGLAQLYQLRGRVGRGAMRAYAYFFRHGKLAPTVEGQERLETIAEYSQLGSGYSIAMRDLEMRGAGDLLGTRQSGYIQAVGFHLYTRLLAAAVRLLRQSRGLPEVTQAAVLMQDISVPVNVDLPLAAGIPAEYISDQDLRLRLYRRLADLSDENSLDALQEEFQDRFGEPPDMLQDLFYQMRVKMRAHAVGLVSISSENGQIVLRFPIPTSEGEKRNRLPDLNAEVRGGKNAYWCTFGENNNWKEKLLDTLDQLKNNA